MPECELYKKYRPRTLGDVKGQDTAVRLLEDFLLRKNLPQALILSGPSGVGKTTVCLILKEELGCSDSDFQKINAADTRGIDTVREIKQTIRLCHSPNSKCRIIFLEEAHHLTRRAGGDAQTALLEMLEFTPKDVYFFLATTHPQELLTQIRTRCTEVRLSPLDDKSMFDVLATIATRERIKILDTVLDKIISLSRGSARMAVNYLNMVIGIESEDEQLELLVGDDPEAKAFDLVKAMLWQRASWRDIAKLITNLGEQNWEGLRVLILQIATTELLKANKNQMRAFCILDSFSRNFYDGKSDLVRACFEVVSPNSRT